MFLPSSFACGRRLASALAFLPLLAMPYGAGAAPVKGTNAAPSFSRSIQPLFDANCVACHQSAGPSGGLNLEDGIAYRALVSQPRSDKKSLYIAPGSPRDSYLLHKLKGTHAQVGGAGEAMPPTGSLDSASVSLIQRWIESGARND